MSMWIVRSSVQPISRNSPGADVDQAESGGAVDGEDEAVVVPVDGGGQVGVFRSGRLVGPFGELRRQREPAAERLELVSLERYGFGGHEYVTPGQLAEIGIRKQAQQSGGRRAVDDQVDAGPRARVADALYKISYRSGTIILYHSGRGWV
jgi:hypothetical protein